jgi:hypothetical protein
MSSAEDAFGQSLEEFDAIMGEEQESMARSGVGTAADEAFGAAGQIGNPAGSSDMPAGDAAAGAEGGESQSESTVFRDSAGTDDTTERVEGCNDQDKVARQLCEAATEEEDPFLRAALWDEYNEYKEIILRQ